LPGEYQLYEIVDGELKTSDRRVTREQLDAFLDSGPLERTIETLLLYVDRQAAARSPEEDKGQEVSGR
jgi:hypothetical protein